MEPMELLLDIKVLGVIFGILIPLLIYRYSTKNFDYFKKIGIPFEKPLPFFGNFAAGFNKNLEDLEIERYNKYGRIYGIFEGNKPMIVVGEPEHIKNILVKDFQYFSTRRIISTSDPLMDNMLSLLRGEDWKRVRNIISPTFSTGKIKRLMNIFNNCSKNVIDHFNESKEKSVDVLKVFGAFAMDIIASSAFSTKIDTHKDPNNEFVRHAKAAFGMKIGPRIALVFIFPRIAKLLRISAMKPEHTEFFKNVILDIMKERKRTGQKSIDFLQLLMDAADEEVKEETEEKSEDITANYGYDSDNHAIFKSITSKHLSMNELIANCLIFFLAGYHTTATTIGLATYLLAINQDKQNKLFGEIEEVLSETNGEPTYEALQKMKYLDNVISETLRIYSPAIRLDRTAEADYELGDTGITIPKGMVVGIPNFAMHRDPKLFPEPEKFKPERFSPEERERQIPYAYLPFGAGPRNCIGMRFALIEVKVCLLQVFCKFHVKTCSETKIPLEFVQAAGLLAPKSIDLSLVARENCPLKC